MRSFTLNPGDTLDGYETRIRKPILVTMGPILNKRRTGKARRPAGSTQGKLTFEKVVAHTAHGHELFGCVCECGSKTLVSASAFNGGRSKSCGCANRGGGYESSYKALHAIYKRNAEKRGVEFDLTVSDLSHIAKQNCTYCGSPPSAEFKASKQRLYQPEGPLLYNGLDRMFNDQGYNAFNCVPCCKLCNRMKSDLQIDEFANHCQKIASFMATGEPDAFGPSLL